MTTVVVGVRSSRVTQQKLRTLYFAHVGACCAGWWDTEPPKLMGELRRCPRFRAPDIYHDHTVGSEEKVIADFIAAKVLPPRDTFRIITIPQEWIQSGLRRVQESKVRKRKERADPEVDGLFAPEDVKPTEVV